jgi:uncharacterized membrane protein
MTQTSTQPLAIEDRTLGHLLYGLMTGFPLFLMPLVLGLLINLSQKQTATSQLMASHLRWQRHAMLVFLGLIAVGFSLPHFWLGMTLYLLTGIWFCHRILKGWLSLIDGRLV